MVQWLCAHALSLSPGSGSSSSGISEPFVCRPDRQSAEAEDLHHNLFGSSGPGYRLDWGDALL